MSDQFIFNFERDHRILAFEKFHAENPHIYAAFKRFAFDARRRRTHYSARDIIHRVRWWSQIESDDDAGWKINNNWSPFYARILVRDDPSFDGFFEMRASVADKERKR